MTVFNTKKYSVSSPSLAAFLILYYMHFCIIIIYYINFFFFFYFLFFSVDTVGIPILEQKLSDLDIEDVTGTTSVPILGDIDYTLSKYSVHPMHIIAKCKT